MLTANITSWLLQWFVAWREDPGWAAVICFAVLSEFALAVPILRAAGRSLLNTPTVRSSIYETRIQGTWADHIHADWKPQRDAGRYAQAWLSRIRCWSVILLNTLTWPSDLYYSVGTARSRLLAAAIGFYGSTVLYYLAFGCTAEPSGDRSLGQNAVCHLPNLCLGAFAFLLARAVTRLLSPENAEHCYRGDGGIVAVVAAKPIVTAVTLAIPPVALAYIASSCHTADEAALKAAGRLTISLGNAFITIGIFRLALALRQVRTAGFALCGVFIYASFNGLRAILEPLAPDLWKLPDLRWTLWLYYTGMMGKFAAWTAIRILLSERDSVPHVQQAETSNWLKRIYVEQAGHMRRVRKSLGAQA